MTNMRTIVETEPFKRVVDDYFPKREDFEELKTFLAHFPFAGNKIPKGEGTRKLRWPAKLKGAGKSGGYRIIYLYDPNEDEVWLLSIYAKSVTENVDSRKLKELKKHK